MNKLPTRKVGTGLVVGQLSAVLVWALDEFARVDMPSAVAVSAAGLIILSFQYVVADK